MKQVIRFTAGWCSPCKMYAKTFDKIATETSGIEFQTIDVDSGDPRVMEYGVRNIPTTVILENGAVVRKQTGNLSSEQLGSLIG